MGCTKPDKNFISQYNLNFFTYFTRLIGLSSIYGYFQRDTRKCNASLELELFFIGAITVTSLVIVNEVAIMYVSMLGTVMEARPRRHMPILLYIQVFLYLPEASWTILGTYWVVNKSVNCELGVTIAVWVSVVLQWSILLAVLIGVMLLFDPLGTLHNHDEEGGVGDGMLKESTKKVCLYSRSKKFNKNSDKIHTNLIKENHNERYVTIKSYIWYDA